MPRRKRRKETPQMALFETFIYTIGGQRVYLKNIETLARMLPPAQRDVANAILANVETALQKTAQAMRAHAALAERVGYTWLNREVIEDELK